MSQCITIKVVLMTYAYTILSTADLRSISVMSAILKYINNSHEEFKLN